MNQKTCKDCIHHEVCKYKDEKVSLGTKVCELVADGFKCFKDKTRIVELPCKVGEKVFCIYSETDGENVIGEPDEITEVGTKGYWVSSVVNEKNMDIFTPYTELGKTEFLTRVEAEKALERMREDEKNNI